jgi:hypothetical protein
METPVREHVILRLIERLDRAVPGDSREELAGRYIPALRAMTDTELGSVWERAAASTDAQLYLIDEIVYMHLNRKRKSPSIGSDVHLLFQTAVKD